MKIIYEMMENDGLVVSLGKEIVSIFEKQANKDNIEYSFDISKETGNITNRSANTRFTFDTNEIKTPLIHSVKKAMFGEDLSNITQKEELQLRKDINIFMQKVAKEITKHYSEILREVIRKVVIPDTNQNTVPINTIKIENIEVVDYDSIPEPNKYLIKIKHNPGTSVDVPEITQYIYDQQEKTQKTAKEVFEKEKNINPLFEQVEELQTGDRYLWDVTIDFFVDYSLAKTEETVS